MDPKIIMSATCVNHGAGAYGANICQRYVIVRSWSLTHEKGEDDKAELKRRFELHFDGFFAVQFT